MVATFTPHRDAGGAIHLPSHAGMHQVDPSSAIRQLRQSLSRSPSKASTFSLLATRDRSPSRTNRPYISSPLSPSRKPPAQQQNNFVVYPGSTSSPFAVPYPPSAKAGRPPHMVQRTRSLNSRSLSRSALNASASQGNVTPCKTASPSLGEENNMPPPSDALGFGMQRNNSQAECTDVAVKPSSTPVAEKIRGGNFGDSLSPGPMKRSDGIMGLDQESHGSPSAKRRSIQTTAEFNIFDKFESEGMGDDLDEPIAAAQNRRSSSLRRSNAQQQRHSDRSIFARSGATIETSGSLSAGTPNSANSARPISRMPSDANIHNFNNSRESPFSLRHPPGSSLFSANTNGRGGQSFQRSHPLSRTITQSSSGSSFADDSPTHEPTHNTSGRPSRVVPGLSESLPIGTSRPTLARQLRQEETAFSTDSFATPENYKHAKPLLAAFMSTGLISKKNRRVEDGSLASSMNMPDTPCKRAGTPFLAGSKMQQQPEQMREKMPAPSSTRVDCRSRILPSSPLNLPTRSRPKSGVFARGVSIFDSIFNRQESTRRGSMDDEERALCQSPSAVDDSRRLVECDLPPTPTKQSFFPSKSFPPPGSLSRSPASDGFGSVGANCKLPAEPSFEFVH